MTISHSSGKRVDSVPDEWRPKSELHNTIIAIGFHVEDEENFRILGVLGTPHHPGRALTLPLLRLQCQCLLCLILSARLNRLL